MPPASIRILSGTGLLAVVLYVSFTYVFLSESNFQQRMHFQVPSSASNLLSLHESVTKSKEWFASKRQSQKSQELEPSEYFFRKPFASTNFSKFRLFWIEDYLKWHSLHRYDGTARTLVYKVQNTGFGDIFRGLLTSYYIAVLSKRVLLVEYPPHEHLRELLELPNEIDFFFGESDAEREKKGEIKIINDKRLTRKGTPKTLLSFLKAARTKVRTLKIIHAKTSQLTALIAEWHSLYNDSHHSPSQCSHLQALELQRILLHEVFQPSRQLRKKKMQFLRRVDLKPGKYVSVHARIGAGVREEQFSRFRSVVANVEHVARCLARVALEQFQEDERDAKDIFLATDTIQFRSIFREAVFNRSRYVRVVVPDWNHTGHITHISRRKRGRVENILNTFTELLVLGNAKRVVHLYSGFPILAFKMGNADSSTRVDADGCASLTVRRPDAYSTEIGTVS